MKKIECALTVAFAHALASSQQSWSDANVIVDKANQLAQELIRRFPQELSDLESTM